MPTTRDALIILVLFCLPGFLTDAVLSKQFARSKREVTELVLNVVLLSVVNYAIWVGPFIFLWWLRGVSPPSLATYQQFLVRHPGWSFLLAFLVFFVTPIAEGALGGWLARSPGGRWFLAHVLDVRVRTIPKAWDYVFSQNRYFIVLATLTDGSKVAGGWGTESFASSYPNDEDLYLEVVYSLDDEGAVERPVPQSGGILLKRSDIRSLEFFLVEERTEASDEQE